MKNKYVRSIFFLIVIIFTTSLSASELESKISSFNNYRVIEIKDNQNSNIDKNLNGIWENKNLFHLDGALLFSMAYYPGMNYSGLNGSFNLLVSMRISGLLDFAFSYGNSSFGFEPVVSGMVLEVPMGDENVLFYALDISARGFARYSFNKSFVQLYGGYFYSVFGSSIINGIEAGFRLAIGIVVFDCTYVFAKQSQIRFSFGYGGRLL